MSHNCSSDQRLVMQDLIGYFASGCKHDAVLGIGTEHEKIIYDKASGAVALYDGDRGIRALLEGIARKTGRQLEYENARPIAIAANAQQGSVTLEPGGQFELSGGLFTSLHDGATELDEHLDICTELCDELGLGMAAIGLLPDKRLDEIPVMPKQRYKNLMQTMQSIGGTGLVMMFFCCTVQANLDYRTEKDMVRKLRVSTAFQPIATALFANSPYIYGRATDYLSNRAHTWQSTDGQRTGILPMIFEDGMGFERYCEWVLDVPMYSVARKGDYIDTNLGSFRNFIDGKLEPVPGVTATMDDWEAHVASAFPEVRLKKFLEMRGADVGRVDMIKALPAFWCGILYDEDCLQAATDLMNELSLDDILKLHADTPKIGLDAATGSGVTAHSLARQLLEIARVGLARRGILNSSNASEEIYLEPLFDILDRNTTQAQELLQLPKINGKPDFQAIYKASAL